MAKTLVGALRVTLGLDSAEFAAGAARVQALSQQMAKRLAVIGAAVSVASVGMANAIRGALNDADRMGEIAQKLGVPVESLSELRHVAKMTGVEFGELEAGLLRLSRGMADQPQKFDALGVAVRDANGEMRPTADVLRELADRFQSMPDGAEKTALAMDLFGRSGAAMIPMLNAGSEGMGVLIQQARDLGLVISDETANSAGRFNDNLDRLAGLAQGLAATIAAELAPTLEWMSGLIVELSAGFQNLSPEWQSFLAGAAGLVVVLGPIILGLGAIVGAVGLLVSPLTLAAAGIAALTAAWMYLIPEMSTVHKFFDDLGIIAVWVIDRMKEKFSELVAGAGELALGMAQAASDTYEWFTVKFQELIDWLSALPEKMLEIGRNIAQGVADGISAGWGAVTSAIQVGNEEAMLGFQEDWQIQSPSQVTAAFGRNIAEGLAEGVTAATGIVGQAVGTLNDTAKGAMQGIGDLGGKIGDMFADAATDVLTGVTSLQEAVGQLLSQLARLLINSAMKSIFGNIFGDLFGGGVNAYATGTMSAASGLALVGEAGPELVRMRGGERVYNDRDTSRLLAGGQGGAQPMQITTNVYLDGEIILSRLETVEGEAAIGRVMSKLGGGR